MTHHWNSQYSFVLLVMAASLLSPTIYAQTIITEMSVPTPLNGVLDVDVYAGTNDRLHIVGTTVGFYSPPTYWDGFRLLFLTSRDSYGATATTIFSDTAWYWNDGLHGEEYRFNRSVGSDAQDNLILFWSKQYAMLSDLPPYTRLGVPTGKCVKRTSGSVLNIFDLERSASPALNVGPDNATHFVWELIRSVRSDSNCVAYSSQLFYRYLTGSGQLTTPQSIDTGFTPRVASRSAGLAHIAWLRGDSSTASVFSLRYRTMNTGTPSPIITLNDPLYKPADLTMGIDSAGVVHLGWTETRPPNQLKAFLLSFNGASTTIDSSQGYSAGRGMLRVGVLPNGVVNAIWAAWGGASDSVYYTSTRTLPPFTTVRSFSHPSFRFVEAQALFTKSNAIPGALLGDTGRMRYLRDLESGSDTSLVLLTGVLLRGSTHPVTVDASDNVWAVYGRSPVGFYQLGLARFADQTTGVDYRHTTPGSFRLNQNFPNPFNPITTIRFEIAERSHVLMTVSDILGREVSRPVDETKSPGEYTVHFDASHLSSGVYFYRLQAGAFIETRKMLLIR
ncbi:MAG: T9SS type A sorting domain-containing protein [Ignavibacteriae bacterium]|nr:T9SS type A sorting domain-containing protein [Ignavibacteriota bacterium]